MWSSIPDERWRRVWETPAAPGGNPAGQEGILREEATWSTCNLIPLDCSSKTFHGFFPPLRFKTWPSRPSKRNLKIALSNKTPVPGVSCHSRNFERTICSSSWTTMSEICQERSKRCFPRLFPNQLQLLSHPGLQGMPLGFAGAVLAKGCSECWEEKTISE